MLRTLFALGLGLVLMSEAATAQAAEPLELVKKAIAAHGGKENLAKYQARTITSKGSVSVGDFNFDYTGIQYFHYPDKYRVDGKITSGDERFDIVQVVSGKEGWQKTGDKAVEKMEGHTLTALQTSLQVDIASTLVPLLDKKKYSVTSVGEFEVKGKKAIGVNVKNKAGLDVNFYFDPKTYLMVKQEFGTKNFFTGQDVLQEVYLSKHKETNGITLPMHANVDFDAKRAFTLTVESLQFHEQLEASLFEKPE